MITSPVKLNDLVFPIIIIYSGILEYKCLHMFCPVWLYSCSFYMFTPDGFFSEFNNKLTQNGRNVEFVQGLIMVLKIFFSKTVICYHLVPTTGIA